MQLSGIYVWAISENLWHAKIPGPVIRDPWVNIAIGGLLTPDHKLMVLVPKKVATTGFPLQSFRQKVVIAQSIGQIMRE